MCKECGCGSANGNTRINFYVKGYTEANVSVIEKALLGMPGVLSVHIHAHDGETFIDYDPSKTGLVKIMDTISLNGGEPVL